MAGEEVLSPVNIGWRLETFVGVFTPLCIAFVALRFYARSFTAGRYDAGDWLIIAALIGQIVASGMAIGSVKQAGVGQHSSYLHQTSPETVTIFFKYLVAISTWYATTESLAKIAVCLLYKRVFPQRPVVITMNITIAVLIGASIAGGLTDLFGCTPFSAHWGTAEEQAAHCVDIEALFVWGSFSNIVTDVVMLVVPIPIVWNLHTSTGIKVGLMITFLFGSIGLITSCLRFAAFYNKPSFTDPTYSAVELIIWTVCEPGVYLIAACLMVYRPLLSKLGISVVIDNKNRVKTNRIPNDTELQRTPRLGESGTTIGFRTMSSSNGFSEIHDSDESSFGKNTGIRTTTDVEVTWDVR